MKKQMSIQLDNETQDEINFLASRWGLQETRNTTAVISRAVERMYMLERLAEKYGGDILDAVAFMAVIQENGMPGLKE